MPGMITIVGNLGSDAELRDISMGNQFAICALGAVLGTGIAPSARGGTSQCGASLPSGARSCARGMLSP
jgi:hypothetical protein